MIEYNFFFCVDSIQNMLHEVKLKDWVAFRILEGEVCQQYKHLQIRCSNTYFFPITAI